MGLLLAIGLPLAICLVLFGVENGMFAGEPGALPRRCALVFPKWFGCAIANHESLAGGLIGAAGTIFAGWLVWSQTREQMDENARLRAINDKRNQDLKVQTLERDISIFEAAAANIQRILKPFENAPNDGASFRTVLSELGTRGELIPPAFGYISQASTVMPTLQATISRLMNLRTSLLSTNNDATRLSEINRAIGDNVVLLRELLPDIEREIQSRRHAIQELRLG
jgi:hypothetical protein